MFKKLRIGSIDYDVVSGKRDKDVDDFGSTRTDNAVIIYRENQTEQQLVNTLLHECLHGLWEHMAIKDKEDEESVCTKIANALCAFYRDNPDFYIWMGEKLDILKPTNKNVQRKS